MRLSIVISELFDTPHCVCADPNKPPHKRLPFYMEWNGIHENEYFNNNNDCLGTGLSIEEYESWRGKNATRKSCNKCGKVFEEKHSMKQKNSWTFCMNIILFHSLCLHIHIATDGNWEFLFLSHTTQPFHDSMISLKKL